LSVFGEENITIENIRDNVYRVSVAHYHSLFMVTEDGIIVTDPIRPSAAKVLKGKLRERFNKPVTHLIYSHNHIDHVYGAEPLVNDSTAIVAQRLAADDLRWTQAPTILPTVTFEDTLTIQSGGS